MNDVCFQKVFKPIEINCEVCFNFLNSLQGMIKAVATIFQHVMSHIKQDSLY